MSKAPDRAGQEPRIERILAHPAIKIVVPLAITAIAFGALHHLSGEGR
jgi:hypothetical protein